MTFTLLKVAVNIYSDGKYVPLTYGSLQCLEVRNLGEGNDRRHRPQKDATKDGKVVFNMGLSVRPPGSSMAAHSSGVAHRDAS